MSHNHNIVDTGKHFVINTLLRTITTETSELVLSQGDHNSERYTFEIPRMVEGHDMSLCNRIEVHYDNISKNKKETNEGFYIVDDTAVNGDDVKFSWLISGNATKLFGSLQFWINFVCTDESDEIIYSWGTDIFKGVRILANNRNTDSVVATFPDVLEQWKKETVDAIDDVEEQALKNIGETSEVHQKSIASTGTATLEAIEVTSKSAMETLDSKTISAIAAIEAKANEVLGGKGTVKSVNGIHPDPETGDVEIETMPGDLEQLNMLIETDMLPAVHDEAGKILTDENGKIILRY